MTPDVDTADYSNAALRDRFEEVVVSTSPKSSKVLHLPDGDDVEPLCGTVPVKKSWRRKEVEVYPSADWYSYCDRCRDLLREDDRVGDAIMEDDW